MRHPFPIFLDLSGRVCVVFGAGPLAEEKVRSLGEAGARVRHVSTEPGPDDLEGAFLAISALMNRAANQRLFEEAERHGVLFNALDDPPHCRFYFPAVHRQGALVVALSTSGQCPALAVRLKESLAKWIGPEYAAFLRLAASARERIRHSGLDFASRRRLWYRLVDGPALSLLQAGETDEAAATFEAILREEIPAASEVLR
ncbi:MAG: bifunctional precorrin-2 dehydrogenase/sirohydrochlorin ferrochelatase [Bryobacteraceae bacterium]|jgi:siroheme synthase-like protein